MAAASHKAKKKRDMDATSNYLNDGANILVVLHKGSRLLLGFKFEMPYSPIEPANTVPTLFHKWIMESESNVDALLGSGARLFNYEKIRGESREIVVMDGPIAAWAFCLHQQHMGGQGSL